MSIFMPLGGLVGMFPDVPGCPPNRQIYAEISVAYTCWCQSQPLGLHCPSWKCNDDDDELYHLVYSLPLYKCSF